jgi:hypothetical protein
MLKFGIYILSDCPVQIAVGTSSVIPGEPQALGMFQYRPHTSRVSHYCRKGEKSERFWFLRGVFRSMWLLGEKRTWRRVLGPCRFLRKISERLAVRIRPNFGWRSLSKTPRESVDFRGCGRMSASMTRNTANRMTDKLEPHCEWDPDRTRGSLGSGKGLNFGRQGGL